MPTQEEIQNMSPEQVAELQKQNCIFCKILKGETPSSIVYKDDKIAAILDINPASKGHLLIYPVDHVPILPLLPRETFLHLVQKLSVISTAVKETMLVEGVSVFIANGAAAGQQSPHFIIHMIPRDDNNLLSIPESQVDQNALAVKLKARLAPQSVVPQPQAALEPIDKKELIARFLETNPAAKKILLEDPEKAEALINQDPEARELFKDIDIKKLGAQLREAVGK